jgi:hypothetical protein
MTGFKETSTSSRGSVISIEGLRSEVRWLPHRDKRPFSAKTGKSLSWSDPKAWSSFADATNAAGQNTSWLLLLHSTPRYSRRAQWYMPLCGMMTIAAL